MTAIEAYQLAKHGCLILPWAVGFVNFRHVVLCQEIVILECPSELVARYLVCIHNEKLEPPAPMKKRSSDPRSTWESVYEPGMIVSVKHYGDYVNARLVRKRIPENTWICNKEVDGRYIRQASVVHECEFKELVQAVIQSAQ